MLLTDEEIEASVKTGGVSWTGYRKDSHGFYTIPILSPYHYQFAKAIEAAVIEKLCAGVEMPEPDKGCEQAAFEKWLSRVLPSGDVTAVESAWKASSDYDEMVTGPCHTEDQLRAYGAAQRAKALEDAAVRCDNINIMNGSTAQMICAKAIRALKGEA